MKAAFYIVAGIVGGFILTAAGQSFWYGPVIAVGVWIAQDLIELLVKAAAKIESACDAVIEMNQRQKSN